MFKRLDATGYSQRRCDLLALASALCTERPAAADRGRGQSTFPLRNGVYYVAAGGSNTLVNPHVATLTAERFRDHRGQSYGIDIVKINSLDLRARGVAPRDPRKYAIFGAAV